MPQLDSSTWMPAFIYAWTTFYTLIPQKIQNHLFLNPPANLVLEKNEKDEFHWTWPLPTSPNS